MGQELDELSLIYQLLSNCWKLNQDQAEEIE